MTTELSVILTAIGTILTGVTIWWVRAAKVRADAAEKERKSDWQEFRDSYSESNDVLRKDRDYYRDAYFNGLRETSADVAALKLELVEQKNKHEAEIAALKLEQVETKLKREQEKAAAKSDHDELVRQILVEREKVVQLETELGDQKRQRESERANFHAEIDGLRVNIATLLPKPLPADITEAVETL